jgi:hypothetical protein
MLFAAFGLGAAGCTGVNEVEIADLPFNGIFVHVSPSGLKDEVIVTASFTFDRSEGDACYELSPGTRASVADHELTANSLGGTETTPVTWPPPCRDTVDFHSPGVPLSATPTDTTIRIEDGSGHVDVTIMNLLVKREVSFIEPADGVIRSNSSVRVLLTPDSDAVDEFNVNFVSGDITVPDVDDTTTHDFQDGAVEFTTPKFFDIKSTKAPFASGAMLEGSLELQAFLTPTVISCGVKGTCEADLQVRPKLPAGLLQE